MIILYESKTGLTEKFAQLLARELNCKCDSLKNALKTKNANNQKVVFLGWVRANKIQGIKKALKNFDVLCVAGVGMKDVSEEYRKELVKFNHAKLPLFYLQGGFLINKMGNFQRKFFIMIGKSLAKSFEEKKEITESEKLTIEMFTKGKSLVSKKQLEEMMDFLNLVAES